jgi:hypothetical protein
LALAGVGGGICLSITFNRNRDRSARLTTAPIIICRNTSHYSRSDQIVTGHHRQTVAGVVGPTLGRKEQESGAFRSLPAHSRGLGLGGFQLEPIGVRQHWILPSRLLPDDDANRAAKNLLDAIATASRTTEARAAAREGTKHGRFPCAHCADDGSSARRREQQQRPFEPDPRSSQL